MVQDATGATPFPLGVFVGNPNYYDLPEEASFETNFNAFSDLMKTKPTFLDIAINAYPSQVRLVRRAGMQPQWPSRPCLKALRR